jgi:hypothetical protein
MNSEIKFVHVKMSHIQRYLHICMLQRGAGEVEPGTVRIHFQVTFVFPWLPPSQLLLITQTLRVRNLLIYL